MGPGQTAFTLCIAIITMHMTMKLHHIDHDHPDKGTHGAARPAQGRITYVQTDICVNAMAGQHLPRSTPLLLCRDSTLSKKPCHCGATRHVVYFLKVTQFEGRLDSLFLSVRHYQFVNLVHLMLFKLLNDRKSVTGTLCCASQGPMRCTSSSHLQLPLLCCRAQSLAVP